MNRELLFQRNHDYMSEHFFQRNGVYQFQRHSKEELEERLRDYFGVRYAILTTSATMALFYAMWAVGVEGKTVAIPSFSFISPAFAALRNGGKVQFVDIDPCSLCSGAEQFFQAEPYPDVVVPVHIGGMCCDMAALKARCAKLQIPVIEDAAQAAGSVCQGKKLGTIGDIGVISFGTSKLMTAGEGGVLLTDSPHYGDRLTQLIHLGRSSPQNTYEHVDVGLNGKLAEVQASMLFEQFGALDAITARRHENAAWLRQRLSELPFLECVSPAWADPCNCYMFLVRYRQFPGNVDRDGYVQRLRQAGVPAYGAEKFPYPIYRNPCFQSSYEAPHAERLYQELLVIGHPSESSLFHGDRETIDFVWERIRETPVEAKLPHGGGKI